MHLKKIMSHIVDSQDLIKKCPVRDTNGKERIIYIFWSVFRIFFLKTKNIEFFWCQNKPEGLTEATVNNCEDTTSLSMDLYQGLHIPNIDAFICILELLLQMNKYNRFIYFLLLSYFHKTILHILTKYLHKLQIYESSFSVKLISLPSCGPIWIFLDF